MMRTFFHFLLACLFTLTGMFSAGAHAQSAFPQFFDETDSALSDDEPDDDDDDDEDYDEDDEDYDELFYPPTSLAELKERIEWNHFPEKYRPTFLEKFDAVYAAAEAYWPLRAETLTRVIHLVPAFDYDAPSSPKFPRGTSAQSVYGDDYFYRQVKSASIDGINHIPDIFYVLFKEYDPIRDPEKESDYWDDSAQMVLDYMDACLEFYTTTLPDLDRKERERFDALGENLTLETLNENTTPTFRYDDTFYTASFMTSPKMPLTEKIRQRILAGKPIHDNPESYDGWLRHSMDRSEIDDFIEKHTLEQFTRGMHLDGIFETPQLKALAFSEAEFMQLDASTSLGPLVLRIQGQAGGLFLSRKYDRRLEYAFSLTETPEPNQEFMDGGFFSWENPEEPPPRFSPTGVAMRNLIAGDCEMIFSVRRPSDDELKLAKEQGVELVCTPFARDAFVFLVNQYNPVESLTREQIVGIYTGKHTAWNDVGGFGSEIVPFIRNRNSGSEELKRDFFAERQDPADSAAVLDALDLFSEDITKNRPSQITRAMWGVYDQLDHEYGGIGYSVLFYQRFMAANDMTRVIAIDGVPPSLDTICSGEYPFIYDCVVIHRKDPKPRTREFIEWLLSDEGQMLVEKSGYVPIRTLTP